MVMASDGLWDVFSSQGAVSFARERLAAHNDPSKCSELEMSVTPEEIDRKSDMCELALFWEAHNTMYAVGNEIKAQLAQGLNVVINVSRTCKCPVYSPLEQSLRV